MDLIYFNTSCAPGDKDWLRGTVLRVDGAGLKVRVSEGLGKEKIMFFPAGSVKRIEYSNVPR